MMDCQRVKELRSLYLTGELSQISPEEVLEIEIHRKECPFCSTMLDRFGQFIRSVELVIQSRRAPHDLRINVQKRIHQSEKRKFTVKSGLFATAALILIGLGIMLLLQPGLQEPFKEIPIPWSAFSTQRVVLQDGSTLRATKQSKYEVTGYRRLRLNHGELWLNIVKDQTPFQIDTPGGKVTVAGTEFVVQVIKERRDRMKVLRNVVAVLVISGMVELANPLGEERVGAGEYAYAHQESQPLKKLAKQRKPQPFTKIAKVIIWGGTDYRDRYDDGAIYDINSGKWEELPEAPIEGRANHCSILWGTKLIVWGGCGYERGRLYYLSDGAIYDINARKWEEIPEAPIKGRGNPTFVVSQPPDGDSPKLIIWGGHRDNDGAIYDINSRKWKKLPRAPIEARSGHISVISGKKLIIWGGFDRLANYSDGAIYDIEADRWEKMPEAPICGRRSPTSVLSGSRLIIWGGCNEGAFYDNGAIYNIKLNKWEKLSQEAPIAGRCGHSSILTRLDQTGTPKLIIWGGVNSHRVGLGILKRFTDGAIYDIQSGRWEEIPPAPIDARRGHTFILSSPAGAGNPKLIIWGGREIYGSGWYRDGAIYDLGKGTWEKMPKAPIGKRSDHFSALLGTKLIIWGGKKWKRGTICYDDGAIYDIEKGKWEKLPEAPIDGRIGCTAVLFQQEVK